MPSFTDFPPAQNASPKPAKKGRRAAAKKTAPAPMYPPVDPVTAMDAGAGAGPARAARGRRP